MSTLIVTIAVLIAIFFAGRHYPLLAGIMAVIPVKVIATMLFSYEQGGKDYMVESLRGIIAGQFSFGILLLVMYVYMIR